MSSIQKQQASYALQFLMLPVSIINQVVSFHETDPNFVLSLYKAFLWLEDSWYKTRILEHLANIAYAAIQPIIDIRSFKLIDREVMYMYDVLFGNIETLLYGDEFEMEHMRHIDNEFVDCTRLIGDLNQKQYFDVNIAGFINNTNHTYVRLLEEAIISKSENLLKCIKAHFYDEWMCLYLFLKQTHQVYKNPLYEATDEELFQLISDANMTIITLVLRSAISGERREIIWNNYNGDNVVDPNLQMVKKIVPAIIPYGHQLFAVYKPSAASTDEVDPDDFVYLSPFEYWRKFDNKVIDFRGGGAIYTERDEAIGKYLRAARPMTWNPDLQQMTMAL
jgi:hypothetical protein